MPGSADLYGDSRIPPLDECEQAYVNGYEVAMTDAMNAVIHGNDTDDMLAVVRLIRDRRDEVRAANRWPER